MEFKDLEKGTGKFRIDKYRFDDETLAKIRQMSPEEEAKFVDEYIKKVKPYQTQEFYPNTWLTTGWNELLKLIAGASANHFDGTNTQIGVGNDNTAAAATQTDLIGASKTYKTVSSGSPTAPASRQTTYSAAFLTSEANYTWNEAVIKNSVSAICWNRIVLAGDVKDSTQAWTITGTIGAA